MGFGGPDTASGSEVEHWEEEEVVVEVSVVLRSRLRPSPAADPSSAMAGLVEGEPSWDFWGLESLAGLEPKKPNQEVLQLIKYYYLGKDIVGTITQAILDVSIKTQGEKKLKLNNK